ncbi:conserved hypothetical protein [Parafrankia sp. Ea1.12]|uniref:tyrosine-type recombinase/integrase n=1 Tax=Parafrankia sp. Ea1.12 TaxID=573499 RepID=UPI000DA43DF3|nr:site-specific integrase [Parafrankia sp. Ea1.12]SQD99528.1 conserved hypothetical protein [Parafrankia sp. Ea1.12]
MGGVHRVDLAPAGPTLAGAAEAFLAEVANRNTARSYRTALAALAAELGPDSPLVVLDTEAGVERIGLWFSRRWGTAAPATANARLDGLRSAIAWWRAQGWIEADPTQRIRRRPRAVDRTRPLVRAGLEALLSRAHLPLRERTLWRLLYETAARAEEVLALDVDDLDLRNRRAKVHRKSGAADVIVWRSATARLLPRLLDDRRTGPVFLTTRRARVQLPAADLDPDTGRARLSYRRAAECFEQASRTLPGGPWTLHQLRHSALTHAAEDGANTSALLAYSGHTSPASLARYARVSSEALVRWQQARDLAIR